MAINFDGWIIQDAEDNLLRVAAQLEPKLDCAACSRPRAGYAIWVVGTGPSVVASCQGCLDQGLSDPRSPDVYYAPVKPQDLVVYSDGAVEAVLHIS